MYKPKHFKLKELVHPYHLETFLEDQIWRLLDDRILKGLELLREELGPIVVNDYYRGGELESCGLRLSSFYSSPSVSQHLHGRAMDIHVRDHEPDWVRKYILINYERYRPFISRIESDTDTWVHIDICNTNTPYITEFGG